MLMQIFMILVGATYSTLLIHGWWHSTKITRVVERGLGRKLRRTRQMYMLMPLTILLYPSLSIWLLFEDSDKIIDEMSTGMVEGDGGATDEQWTAVHFEVAAYKETLK